MRSKYFAIISRSIACSPFSGITGDQVDQFAFDRVKQVVNHVVHVNDLARERKVLVE